MVHQELFPLSTWRFFNSIMFVNVHTSFLTDKNSADACSLEAILSRQNSLVCLIIS